jgi:hypothetical protein
VPFGYRFADFLMWASVIVFAWLGAAPIVMAFVAIMMLLTTNEPISIVRYTLVEAEFVQPYTTMYACLGYFFSGLL